MMIKILSNRLNLVKKNVNKLVIINQTRQYANVKSDDLNVKSNESTTDQPSHDLGHFDIVINGGGIVGLTFLFNLQTNQFLKKKRILLIEQQNRSKLDVKTDNKRVLSNRVSSLTEASKRCFEKNGIWSEIDQYVKRIREMQIWSSNLNKAISFDANDELGSVCYIVENNRILNALNRNLDHEQILYSTNVVDIKEIDNKINLFTESKLEPNLLSKLTCNLLIGCDGYNSLVRQKSNLDYFNLPLDQNGVVGTITMCPAEDNSDNSISYQRFLADPQAVIAILPLTNEESSFVISTDKMFAKQLVEINEKDFVDQFNHLLDCEIEHCLPYLIKNLEVSLGKSLPTNLIKSTRKRTLPKISAVQSRASFPLGFGTTLPSLVGSIRKSSNINLAIIGDSAHRVHPLAGQGLNLGIGDAIVLSNCLNASLERGEELFDCSGCPLAKERLENALNEFERERQLKLIAMMSTIHSMQDLFYYTPPVLLNAFDHMNWIKKQMVVYANSV